MGNFIEFLRRKKLLLSKIISTTSRYIGLIGLRILPTYHPAYRTFMSYARAGYYSAKAKISKGVKIDQGVIIRGNLDNLEIGDYSYIDTNVQLEIYGPLKIGKYVHIAPNAYIQSGSKVVIGDFACIANGVKIYSSSNTYKTPNGKENIILFSLSSSAPKNLQAIKYGPVIIEDFAFVGMNTVVLPGVKIGRAAIIGAGAVVTKDIPLYSIAVGVPAKVIMKRPVPKEVDNICQSVKDS